MPRHPNISMKATNDLLDAIGAAGKVGEAVETETSLSARLSISRTVARSAFVHLESIGVLSRPARHWQVARKPESADYYAFEQIESRADLVERRFMQIARNGDLVPGQQFTEAEMARQFGASTVSVREFLIGFSRYGLMQKAANGSWRFCAFDESFARELAAFRQHFEINGIRLFAQLAKDNPAWANVDSLLARHRLLLGSDDQIVHSFSALDRQLHQAIVTRLSNRFVHSFYDVVSFVFHYHYQWRKDTELIRHTRAIEEHIAILTALQIRDFDGAVRHMEVHLETALRTLLESAIRQP